MITSSPRNSVQHNQQAKLAVDYNELLKELSSHEMTSVGCYTIGETIGEGTFGKVKKGIHKLTGRIVAIKKISKQHAPMMAREIHHHRQLKHANIVMLYEMITTESAIHIISEYCPNGDLLDALTDNGRCSEIRVHKWFRQLTDAIKYCHTRGIVHRDLKLENILLDADDNVKICDFGFARFTQKNQYLETFCGSLSYSAPEVILHKKYTGPETDIWSLGVILYTLLAGEYPFDDDSEIMTQRKIVSVDYEIPFYFSDSTSDLVRQMLQLEPSNRITIDAIVDHPWLNETEEEEEEDYCLTPSSSTTTSNTTDVDSIFSVTSNNTNAIASTEELDFSSLSPDLKFSPQVRSSLGIQNSTSTTNKSPRFSAPTLNRKTNNNSSPSSPLLQSSFRTSLPSSFHSSRDSGVFGSVQPHMTPIEQRLFNALTAAGFDRDALIKMQTGSCDTSSTLWHLLLENMTSKSSSSPAAISSVPDAFASAIQSRSGGKVTAVVERSSVVPVVEKHAVDCGVQTTIDLFSSNSSSSVTVQQQTSSITNTPLPPTPTPVQQQQATTDAIQQQYIQPYPRQVTNRPPNTIQTVGFGSSNSNGIGSSSSSMQYNSSQQHKSGWFSSVKTWFGSKQQLQEHQKQLQLMEQQNELILQHQQKQQQRSRSSSNCSTMSSPIAQPSSYRNFDVIDHQEDLEQDGSIMSPPIYRTGSTKYRRRVLQLSEPPVSELDQLTYNGTYTKSSPPSSKQQHKHTNSSSSINHITTTNNTSNTIREFTTTPNNTYSTNQQKIQLNMPPTALTSSSRAFVTDTFSILSAESKQLQEIDICEKRYSMMYHKRSGSINNKRSAVPSPQQQPTPPPSPPTAVTTGGIASQQQSANSPMISPMDERLLSDSLVTRTESATSSTETIGTIIEDNEKLSDFSSDSSSSSSEDDDDNCISECEEEEEEEQDKVVEELSIKTPTPPVVPSFVPSVPVTNTQTTTSPFLNRIQQQRSNNRFEFAAPRSRLSIYGMQEPTSRGSVIGSKTIIEEEEEEEEE